MRVEGFVTQEQEPILDHGYLRLIETWGSDERIVEAARMSTQKGFLGWGSQPQCAICGEADIDAHPVCNASDSERHDLTGKGPPGDEKLLRYLYENKHATPFEFAGLVVEVQAPIFVFREWHRHRTQSYNEMSARYAPLPDLNYIPSVDRLMLNARADGNKQAGTVADAEALTEKNAHAFQVALDQVYKTDQGIYEWALRMGVPKELARVHLPVGRYSRMRASTCLRNWLGFMTLRSAKSAQWEIRRYSEAIGRLVARHFPRTWALFAEERS